MALSNWENYICDFDIIKTRVDNLETEKIDKEIAKVVNSFKDDISKAFGDPKFNELSELREEKAHKFDIKISKGEGTFVAIDNDLAITLYKNWLYLSSKTAYQAFKEANMSTGFVENTLMEIQEGEFRIGNLNIEAKRISQEGIAVCAYISDYIPETKQTHLKGMVACSVYAYDQDKYVGITESSFKEFEKFTNQYSFLKNIDYSSLEKYNQGDQYFAQEYGIETPTSKPGHIPLLHDAIKGLNNRKDF